MAVVEHGSFTAGAVALSTMPSVLSRAVTRLEARLGRQLLQRTTRRVRLSAPTTNGHYRLPPVLARFAQQYPQVQVELNAP